MSRKTIFRRVAAVAAGLGAASAAHALTGTTINGTLTAENAPITQAVTVALSGSVANELIFRIFHRSTATDLVIGTGPADSVDFGEVFLDTAAPAGTGAEGAFVDLTAAGDNGTVMVAQLHAELYFVGFDSVSVKVVETGTHDAPPAAARGTDYEFYSHCIDDDANTGGSPLDNDATSLWRAVGGGLQLPAGKTAALSATAFECFSGVATDAGTSIGADVDLALYFAPTAPVGTYQATYLFSALTDFN